MTLPVDEKVIQAMVDKIVAKFKPEKVILFGSYARGNPTKDSDVDLLVVMKLNCRHIEMMQEIYSHLGSTGISKDIVVFTPEDVEKYGDSVGTILKQAMQEGKVFYAK